MPEYKVIAHISNIEVLVEADSKEEAEQAVLDTGALLHEVPEENTSKSGTILLTNYDTIEIDNIELTEA